MGRNRLRTLLNPVSEELAVEYVSARATYLRDRVRLFLPKTPYKKKQKGYEETEQSKADNPKPNVNKSNNQPSESNIERSLRKTKQIIRGITDQNTFDLFCTFTFSPEKTADRADVNGVKRQMNNWLHNVRNRYGKFGYLIVPEFHKDGVSLHFHALFKDYPGKLIPTDHFTKRGQRVHHIAAYTLGYNTAVYIDNQLAVSAYVQKYIVKGMPVFAGRRRFWGSKNLKRPDTEDNPDLSKFVGTPLSPYVSDYGLILDYPLEPES